jgi:hypothetical protein
MSFTFQIWPPPIATALAAGRRGSPVNIRPLRTARSAGASLSVTGISPAAGTGIPAIPWSARGHGRVWRPFRFSCLL